ncbi:MAG: hypothetical protein OQJ78_10620 [Ignavibacteriaceae bacterium]|jgi:nicotinic acid phosphoribosyltransferase|nr:hypothetical protein [Ignavibacteriaceae bacterium]
MTLTEESLSEVSEQSLEKNMSKKKLFYYRIFDDKEKLNYLKSSLSHEEVEHWLQEYERTHQKYFNPEFINYLHEHDPEAEIIEISDISY